MARLSRDNKNSNVIYVKKSYLHWLIILNLAMTAGLYYILLSGK